MLFARRKHFVPDEKMQVVAKRAVRHTAPAFDFPIMTTRMLSHEVVDAFPRGELEQVWGLRGSGR